MTEEQKRMGLETETRSRDARNEVGGVTGTRERHPAGRKQDPRNNVGGMAETQDLLMAGRGQDERNKVGGITETTNLRPAGRRRDEGGEADGMVETRDVDGEMKTRDLWRDRWAEGEVLQHGVVEDENKLRQNQCPCPTQRQCLAPS